MMSMDSLIFFVFMVFAVIVYYSFPQRFKPVFLLFASLVFYSSWNLKYTVLLIFVIILNFYFGLWIKANQPKKFVLILGITMNVFILVLFRYSEQWLPIFRHMSLLRLHDPSGIVEKWIVPLGISYFTFKNISYLVDVYRETIEPTRKILEYALYVAFFLSVSMGPIDRANSFLSQINTEKKPDWVVFRRGFQLILWGLFKKVVIADRLSVMTQIVFSSPDEFHGINSIMAFYGYAIQIFCDFSGYMDIAIGTALLFGYRLTPNFNKPYLASSISDFWQRWHMTLSIWLRDYLFMPLSEKFLFMFSKPLLGIPMDSVAYIGGIFITWIIAGIWHGATLPYVVWGLMQAVFLSYSHFTLRRNRKMKKKLEKTPILFNLHHRMQVIVTFHLVCLSFLIFRSPTVTDALVFLKHLPQDIPNQLRSVSSVMVSLRGLGYSGTELVITLFSMLLFFPLVSFSDKEGLPKLINSNYAIVRWMTYYSLTIMILFFSGSNAAHFTYLQF